MKTVDYSLYFVTYNFIIGILLTLSSEKIGAGAGYFFGAYRERASRLARLGTYTFGMTVAVLSAGIYLAGQVLKL